MQSDCLHFKQLWISLLVPFAIDPAFSSLLRRQENSPPKVYDQDQRPPNHATHKTHGPSCNRLWQTDGVCMSTILQQSPSSHIGLWIFQMWKWNLQAVIQHCYGHNSSMCKWRKPSDVRERLLTSPCSSHFRITFAVSLETCFLRAPWPSSLSWASSTALRASVNRRAWRSESTGGGKGCRVLSGDW